MNQNTRALYDAKTTRNRSAITQIPASYVLDPVNEHRLYRSAGPENIEADTELRMRPTRLNYFNRPEAELYGTAPYRTRGNMDFIDTESMLRDGDHHSVCNSHITERHFRPHDIMDDPLVLDTALRGASTRADVRNAYCDVSGRAHSVETHTTRN